MNERIEISRAARFTAWRKTIKAFIPVCIAMLLCVPAFAAVPKPVPKMALSTVTSYDPPQESESISADAENSETPFDPSSIEPAAGSPDTVSSSDAKAEAGSAAQTADTESCPLKSGETGSPESLPLFYTASNTSVTRNGDMLSMTGTEGRAGYAAENYSLQEIQFSKDALPPGDQAYILEIRFVHAAVDGKKLILSLPVATGDFNMAFEAVLSQEPKNAVKISGFLPLDRTVMIADRSNCASSPDETYLIFKTPLTISSIQASRFDALFTP